MIVTDHINTVIFTAAVFCGRIIVRGAACQWQAFSAGPRRPVDVGYGPTGVEHRRNGAQTHGSTKCGALWISVSETKII